MLVGASGPAILSGFAEAPTLPRGGLVDAADAVLASNSATAPTNPVEPMANGWIGVVGVADLSVVAASASTPTPPTEHLMHFRSVAVPDVVLVSVSARTPTPRTASDVERRRGKGGVNPDFTWRPGSARMPAPLPLMEGTRGEDGRDLETRVRWGEACGWMRGEMGERASRLTALRARAAHAPTGVSTGVTHDTRLELTSHSLTGPTLADHAPHANAGSVLERMAMAALPPSHFIRRRQPPACSAVATSAREEDARRMYAAERLRTPQRAEVPWPASEGGTLAAHRHSGPRESTVKGSGPTVTAWATTTTGGGRETRLVVDGKGVKELVVGGLCDGMTAGMTATRPAGTTM